MNRKKLIYIVNCLDVGGAEIQVVRLAQGMIRRNWRVAIVSLLKPGPLAQPLAEMGAEVQTLSMRAGVPNPRAILTLHRIVRQLGPCVVHSHILHANLLARITRLITPMPVLICTAHNLREGGRLLEHCYRYTDALADLTTNVSQAAVDRYVQVGIVPKDRIRFVPNGLDPIRYHCDPAERARLRTEMGLGDQFVWLAVGRFREQKDYPNLLRAFAVVAKTEFAGNPLLLIAGTGPGEKEAMKLAHSLGLADRVRFLGFRSDVPALMNISDAFVLSSAWEGMPLVLQEAAASALPIVATDVGGNREVALDEISAFLVPPQDSAPLADAMQKLMRLPQTERDQMGQAGRDHVSSNYSMERVLDRWEAIYAEMSDRRENTAYAISDGDLSPNWGANPIDDRLDS